MKMPNCLRGREPLTQLLFLAVVQLLANSVQSQTLVTNKHQEEPARSQPHEAVAANEISTSGQLKQTQQVANNSSQFSRDVTNLRLSPDLRSIKLRWSFEHKESNRPESFRIRYCELTSWLAEIKCRYKELPVVQVVAGEQQQRANDANSTAVITMALVAGGPQIFETQIYDLRALTNYTFQVQVARFAGESAASRTPLSSGNEVHVPRQRPSRRLELAGSLELTAGANSQHMSSLTSRTETTKPFSAEALKCLADSSEVLVNTGRFFGGRISVEGQTDARCQLAGNKTSDQSVYKFHIDHALCHSKIIDGNRIETMILVHENKDILTHNTARFLVQCNIGQQSFTVKASVSLPRVMSSLANGGGSGQTAPSRAAVITPLAANELPRADGRVHLGSMPGVYRPTRADSGDVPPHDGAISATTSNYLAQRNNTDQTAQGGVESAMTAARQSTAARSLRQSKELVLENEPPLPMPVSVSSRILFVERAGEPLAVTTPLTQREARLMAVSATQPHSLATASALRRQQSATHSNGDQVTTIKPRPRHEDNLAKLTLADEEPSATAVIMTNNHRVAGNFASLAQHQPPSQLQSQPHTQLAARRGADDFSIKYSTSRVDEYSLNRLAPDEPTAPSGSSARSRSGRMRHLDTSTTSLSSPITSPTTPASVIESRMGETPRSSATSDSVLQRQQQDTLGSEASSEHFVKVPEGGELRLNATLNGQPTLAHNITGALIRWSLKTLGNLARKSLESLVVDERIAGDGNLEGKGSDEMFVTSQTPFQLLSSTLPPQFNRHDSGLVMPSMAPRPARTMGEDTSQLDGFLISAARSRQTSAMTTSSPTTSTATAQTRRPIAQKSGQISKAESVDQMRHGRQHRIDSTASVAEPRALPTSKPASHVPPIKSKAIVNRQLEEADAALSSQETWDRSSLWPVYSLWALCGLISLIMIAIYFVLMAPRHSGSFQNSSYGCQPNRSQRKTSRGESLSCLNGAFQAPTGSSNSNVNTSKGQDNKSLFQTVRMATDIGLGGLNQQEVATLPSSPIGSATTRSTSAASSTNSLGSNSSPSTTASGGTGVKGRQENYCKNQEQYVVFADHLVLTDDNSSLGYEDDDSRWLTRSGRRPLRHPGESFA